MHLMQESPMTLMLDGLKKRLVGWGSCFSRSLNVARGGLPDMTLSAASYYESLKIEKYINWFFALFGDYDHCKKWFWHDVQEAKGLLGKAEKLEQE